MFNDKICYSPKRLRVIPYIEIYSIYKDLYINIKFSHLGLFKTYAVRYNMLGIHISLSKLKRSSFLCKIKLRNSYFDFYK